MEIIGVPVIAAIWLAIGLAFLMIAARFVTRVFLDEIAKDRARRGSG